MTESEWLKSNDPIRMYACARKRCKTGLKSVKRKFRLYACSCFLPIWQLLTKEGRAAVRTSEDYADGLATKEQLVRVRDSAKSGHGSSATFYSSFAASLEITKD